MDLSKFTSADTLGFERGEWVRVEDEGKKYYSKLLLYLDTHRPVVFNVHLNMNAFLLNPTRQHAILMHKLPFHIQEELEAKHGASLAKWLAPLRPK
ncbi:MAG: hypothetical protein ACK5XN_31950 [Bacteroidota bacterium]|jgi:hypothetical protein